MAPPEKPSARRREYQRAIKQCNSSLAIQPRDVAALRRRGDAKRKLGQLGEALADFDAALAMEPRSANILALRGATKRAMLRHREAISDFDAALKLQPGSVPVLLGRATARRALDTMEEKMQAMTDLDAALELEPRNALALQIRGELRRKLGQPRTAIEDFDAALVVQPLYAAALAGRGAARRQLGDYQQAVADYDAALAMEPNGAAMLSGRGAAKLELARFSDAVADFEHALRIDPQDAYAKWGRDEGMKGVGKTMDSRQTITLAGFSRTGMNSSFTEYRDEEYVVNGRATYWSSDREHFIFWCKNESRWKANRAADLAKIRNGRGTAVAAAPVGEDLFCPSLFKGWFEWDGMVWKLRANAGIASIGRQDEAAKPPRSFVLTGFNASAFNTTFVERREPKFAIDGHPSFLSMDGGVIIYYSAKETRWKGSRAVDIAKIKAGGSPAVLGAPPGEDLFNLGPARLKGWHEWDGSAWKPCPNAGIASVGKSEKRLKTSR